MSCMSIKFCHIPLTRGLFAIVDRSDYKWLSLYFWQAIHSKGKDYASRAARSWEDYPVGARISMAREILEVINPNLTIDHINGDSLDNRRRNLRICTQADNVKNSNRRIGLSGFRGVSWKGTCWYSQIGVDGRRKFLGYFHCPVLAAKAYDEAARKFHGEFAITNFKGN